MAKFQAMIRLLLSVLGLSLWLGTTSAQAYQWITLSESGGSTNGQQTPFLGATLNFSPDVIAAGSFSYSGTCAFPGNLCAPGYLSGNFGDFSISPGIAGAVKPIIFVNINVNFNADGTLSGVTDYNDIGADFFLSGTGNLWTGQFNSDLISCHDPNPCQVTGYWQGTPIPEPSTWAVLLIGIAAIGFAKRPKRHLSV